MHAYRGMERSHRELMVRQNDEWAFLMLELQQIICI